jgi:Protein of unknown function (DUF3237)
MSEPTLAHFCDLTIDLAPNIEMGEGRAGVRRIIPIIGGEVRGPHLEGRILPIGADWQTITRDGVAELEARYAFETNEGAVVEIDNRGVRHGPPEVLAAIAAGEDVDPSDYYMRTHARLESGHPDWQWVNRMMFVGTGGKVGSQVKVSLYVVS